ncbi:MAG: serine hydrolase [Candidatus Omnitrophota bacterium]
MKRMTRKNDRFYPFLTAGRYSRLFLRCIPGVAVFMIMSAAYPSGRGADEAGINAETAVIADAETGKVLYAKNPDKRFPPASTAKLMTAIIAVENMPLTQEIVPSGKVLQVEPTIAGLRPGVRYKLEDLLAAILIKSSNDAAFAIAEAVAGSEKKFAVMMNAKAKELGMENTYFVTASGLPTGKKDRQYTTATDLVRMMLHARGCKVILENMSKREAYIRGDDNRKIYLKTHNKSLLKNESAPWGKTGYTKEARRTFVGIDASFEPRIAFALLKSTDLWNDIEKLNDIGLELHERNKKNFVSDIVDWIKGQRHKGKNESLELCGATR